LADKRKSFAFETTLAGRSYAPWLTSLRQTGYRVHLIYFWLASADLAIARVAQRVRMGGHDVPVPTIRQRYQRSLRNFFSLYRPLVNFWQLYDNTQMGLPQLIAYGEATIGETVLVQPLWDLIRGEQT
jgi:predicted ABC-type ATPase